MSNYKEDLQKVKAFAFDVDGVFSNANVYLHPNGEMMRTMNIKDGFAVKFAVDHGFPIAIITGGNSEAVRKRFNDIGVGDVYIKSPNKRDDFEDFIIKYELTYEDVLYMGDDLPDYEIMKRVLIAACPADAVEEIKSISRYISHCNGGYGCVRDVIEQVMRAQDSWFKIH